MKKTFLFVLALLSWLTASAQTLVDGVYYNFDSSTKQASVTSGRQQYSGSVTIPATITYNNVTYNVTSIGDHPQQRDNNRKPCFHVLL